MVRKVSKKGDIVWAPRPTERNYPAAEVYLNLIYPPRQAAAYVNKLKQARIVTFKAKDIFRASGLSLLGVSNKHVENDKDKISAGQALSPLLLVRDSSNAKVIIADGYHRLCAVYGFNEDAQIPCQIV